ncbi:hypothetical protein CIB48_g9512, partial [Xylaria polymorpha]
LLALVAGADGDELDMTVGLHKDGVAENGKGEGEEAIPTARNRGLCGEKTNLTMFQARKAIDDIVASNGSEVEQCLEM